MEKEFTAELVRVVALKKYNNPLTSGMWFTKYPKDAYILALVQVDQKLADNSRKSSEKYKTYST